MKSAEVVVISEEQRARLRREVDSAFDMLLGAIAGTQRELGIDGRCAAVATAQYGMPACRCEREAGHAGHHKHSAWHWAENSGPFKAGDPRNEEVLRKDLADAIARAEASCERAETAERELAVARAEVARLTATAEPKGRATDEELLRTFHGAYIGIPGVDAAAAIEAGILAIAALVRKESGLHARALERADQENDVSAKKKTTKKAALTPIESVLFRVRRWAAKMRTRGLLSSESHHLLRAVDRYEASLEKAGES